MCFICVLICVMHVCFISLYALLMQLVYIYVLCVAYLCLCVFAYMGQAHVGKAHMGQSPRARALCYGRNLFVKIYSGKYLVALSYIIILPSFRCLFETGLNTHASES